MLVLLANRLHVAWLNKDRIRIIYLTSGTQGVVAQSPEPGAHDNKCLTEKKIYEKS